MRGSFLVIVLCMLFFRAFSQEDFRRFSLGFGGGITTNKSDLAISESGEMAKAMADFYLTRYISGGISAEAGTLSGSEDAETQRYFQNDYKAVILSAKIHMGQFTSNGSPYRRQRSNFINTLAKGIYFGSGGGILASSQSRIRRNPVNNSSARAYRGQNSNKELFIPVLAGMNYYVGEGRHLILSLEYQVNFILGDNMDGYLIAGSRNDVYSSAGIGIRYAFGRLQRY